MLFANREYCKDFLLAFCLLYIRPKHLSGRDTQSHVSENVKDGNVSEVVSVANEGYKLLFALNP